jgi:hypothetical protein
MCVRHLPTLIVAGELCVRVCSTACLRVITSKSEVAGFTPDRDVLISIVNLFQ